MAEGLAPPGDLDAAAAEAWRAPLTTAAAQVRAASLRGLEDALAQAQQKRWWCDWHDRAGAVLLEREPGSWSEERLTRIARAARGG